jgi:2,3-bisphosphoglycerate-dependent phosphoglycerate mutase
MASSEIKDQASVFVFLRHGESTANAENRHQGQADYQLSDVGRQQAISLKGIWESQGAHFDLAISSPLIRAKETAEIILTGTGTDLVFDPLWVERNNGKLAGLLFEEALELLPPPDFIPLYQPIAGTGESQWELYLRAGQALNQLLKNPPGHYLIVSHGGLLNMVMHAIVGLVPQPNFQGVDFRFSNTGYTTTLYLPYNSSWSILEHNNTGHLGG